ncbi:hypothetical protein D3C75_1082100 [compost metagenome]
MSGHLLRGRTHLVSGGRNLLNLSQLLLHAATGARCNRRRLVSRGPGVHYAMTDLRDNRLQLIEESIEPTCQPPHFVPPLSAESPGQIAFAIGDVFQHFGYAPNRLGDTCRQ